MDPDFIDYMQPIIPSLKNTATVVIVARLLAQPDIRRELLLLRSTPKHRQMSFRKVEKKIRARLIPIVSKDVYREIINFVQPMGLQLLRCFDESEEEYYNLYNHSTPDGSLTWTANGTIDKIRTLKHVILDESREREYIFLFKLACKYCYEECMLELWNKIPAECQERIYNEGDYLTCYWIITLKHTFPVHFEHVAETGDSHSTLELMMLSVFEGNVFALKYFILGEKGTCVSSRHFRQFAMSYCRPNHLWNLRHGGANEHADIFLVLLSSFNKYQGDQKQLFKTRPKFVLKSLLLNWPWQKYFLPTINAMWDFLEESLYSELMSTIAEEAKVSDILLLEVWRSSPRRFRKYLVRHSWNNHKIIKKLLQNEEVETLKQSFHDIFNEEVVEIDMESFFTNIMSTVAADAKNGNGSEILFIEVWRISSSHLRKSLIFHCWNDHNVIKKLLEHEEKETVIRSFIDIFDEEGMTRDKENLYREIMSTFVVEAKDRNAQEILLVEVWRSSPRYLKQCLVRDFWSVCKIIEKLLHHEEMATVVQTFLSIFNEEEMTFDKENLYIEIMSNLAERSKARNAQDILLVEVWRSSPRYLKQCLVRDSRSIGKIIATLLHHKEMATVVQTFLSILNEEEMTFDKENLYIEIMSNLAAEAKYETAIENLLLDLWRNSPRYLRRCLVRDNGTICILMKKLLHHEELAVFIQSFLDVFHGEEMRLYKEVFYIQIMSSIVADAEGSDASEILFMELWCNSPRYLRKCLIRHIWNNRIIMKKLLVRGEMATVIQSFHDIFDEEGMACDKENLYIEVMSTFAAEAKDRNELEILFIELWRSSLRYLRKYLIRHSWSNCKLIKILFQHEETKNIIQSLHDIFDEEGVTMDNYKILIYLNFNILEYINKSVHKSITSDEKLIKLKSQFMKENFSQLLEAFDKQDDIHKFIEFQNFVDCFCCSGSENFNENCYEYIIEAIKSGCYEFAKIIFSTCYLSVSDAIKFKNEMMLSTHVIDFFIQNLQQSDRSIFEIANLKNIVEWLSPFYKTTVDEMKCKLKSFFYETISSNEQVASDNMDALLCFLDSLVEIEYIPEFYHDVSDDDPLYSSEDEEDNDQGEVN